MSKLFSILIFFSFTNTAFAQQVIDRDFTEEEYAVQIDSLRQLNGRRVSELGNKVELATQLALLHYPELRSNRIKIRYKSNVQYPITASWSFWNIFKPRRWHTYIVLIKPGTFVDKVSLNKGVGIIGHEMAHFAYSRKRPSVAMLWWGFKYITFKKFRYRFEREADYTAIDHGLGYQLLEISFYIGRQQVLQHMKAHPTLYGTQ